MDKVLAKPDAMEQKFDAKFSVLGSKLTVTQWFVIAVFMLLTLAVAILKFSLGSEVD